jgi:competence protein ComEA
MWKDFFFFSGSQRAGIILLLILIVIALLVINFLPAIITGPALTIGDDEFERELQLFSASLVSLDSISDAARKTSYAPREHFNLPTSSFRKKQQNVHFERFPFDPNTLDSLGLLTLGLPYFVVNNIMRFRLKGGKFQTVDRFGDVYGLTPELFNDLKPYIRIENTPIVELISMSDEPPLLKIELNKTDSNGLLAIKGIKRRLVFSILRFRDACGGFTDIHQLLEVNGMTEEQFALISNQLTVDASLIHPIRLNFASVDRLRAHPYLNFYQAKAIFELRRRKGKLTNIYELLPLEEIDSLLLVKMNAYLSFE